MLTTDFELLRLVQIFVSSLYCSCSFVPPLIVFDITPYITIQSF